MPELVAVFLVGLLGSAHCVGMCGGFVLALVQRQHGPLHQGLYYLGKTFTYVALGAIAGGLSAALQEAMASSQQAVSLLLGLFLVVSGLGVVGILQRIETRWGGVRLPGMERALGFVLQRKGAGAVLGLGLVNGFLPCGLVYGMLALAAASGSALQGMVLMATFGLATIPALYVLSAVGTLMRPLWRVRLNTISGLLMIGLGLLTMARGTAGFDTFLHGEQAAPHASHEVHHPMVP